MSLGKRLISTDAAGGGPVVNTDNFSIITYTGTNSSQATNSLSSQSGTINFQPDLVWIKSRSHSTSNELNDSVRGQVSRLFSDSTSAEGTVANGFLNITSNGFSLDDAGGGGDVNSASRTYVAWAWKAGGPAANNTDGAITSSVSANTAAGFSIVKFAATNTSIQVGHGLSSSPNMIIYKNLDTADNWYVYHSGLTSPNTQWLKLNSSDAVVTSGTYNFSAVTSSTFTSHLWAGAGSNDIIAYCFADIAGYQKIGSYTGTGGSVTVSDVGFQPRWIMIKRTEGAGDWEIVDSVRGDGGFNTGKFLEAGNTGVEFHDDDYGVTFTTTGFTIPSGAANSLNVDGEVFIYLAIA